MRRRTCRTRPLVKAWSAWSPSTWPLTLASLAEAPSSFVRVHHCNIGDTTQPSMCVKKNLLAPRANAL